MTERDQSLFDPGNREWRDHASAAWQEREEQVRDRAFIELLDHESERITSHQLAYWVSINGQLLRHVPSPADRERVRLAVARWLRMEPKPPYTWDQVRRHRHRAEYYVWVSALIEINCVMPTFIVTMHKHRPTLVNAERYVWWGKNVVPKDKGMKPEEVAPIVAWQRLVPLQAQRTVTPGAPGEAGSSSDGLEKGAV